MQNKRRYKRFKLDIVEISGKMSLADNVEIIDISLGGVSLKADGRLNIGKEYLIKLEDQEQSVDLRGIIVRSELSGVEERANGERVSVYTAGMMFKDGQSDKIAAFFNSLVQGKEETGSVKSDRRGNVRFRITAPQEKVLSFPAQFMVKSISLSGMRIQTDHALRIQSMIPMALSLDADNPVNFTGRVASCRMMIDQGQAHYEIGVEFRDLTDKDSASIQTFIDYLAETEADAEGEKKGN